MTYRFAGALSPELVRFVSERDGAQLFTKRELRKPLRCAECKRTIPKGQPAFGPLTNALNRRDRICVECAVSLASVASATACARNPETQGDTPCTKRS